MKEYRYSLQNNTFINHINKITNNKDCMDVEVTTYSLQGISVSFCPQDDRVEESVVKRTNKIDFGKQLNKNWKTYTAVHKDTPSN